MKESTKLAIVYLVCAVCLLFAVLSIVQAASLKTKDTACTRTANSDVCSDAYGQKWWKP